MEKFVALFDAHVGYERRGGHKVAIHDPKALSVAMQFIGDFKPDHVILGGDMLDCGAISHHTKGKPGLNEGLRILGDAKELRETVIDPLEKLVKGRLVYHTGNHEDWLNDLVEETPGLEDLVSVRAILGLKSRWEVMEDGELSKLGKLIFIHGDQLSGGEHMAKSAVISYEANVRFGHFHTFQVYTKTAAIDANGHTGVAVPCLCKKGPQYGKGKPNRWMQGFLWGYVNAKDSTFNDYVSIIVGGKAVINGKQYCG